MYLSALINAQEQQAPEAFVSTNPALVSDVLGQFAHATAAQCRTACEQARVGFQTWKDTPAPVRAQVITNFCYLLQKNKESLACLVTREMGKPIKEARGDVQEAIDTCIFFASEGRRLYGQTVPSEMPQKELFTYRRPIGVFACITAGNFPVAVPSWYLVPALLCGNTCVWKPSEDTPAVSMAFAKLLYAAGVPANAFHILLGSGPKTGAALIQLVDEGLIDKVGFTGSTAVGRDVGAICGRNLQIPCLELGGKNPLVVMPDANWEQALHGVLWSAFGTAGQRCTSLGNLLVHTSIKDAFVKELVQRIAAIAIGDPSNTAHMYGPLMGERFLKQHEKHLQQLVEPHHTLLMPQNGRITTSNQPKGFGGRADEGFYAFPSIVDNVRPQDAIFLNETFGPLFNVLPFSTLDEAIALANAPGYGLSSAIYTQSMESAYRFKNGITAGMTSINNSTSGAEAHLPFGGNGRSGNGSRQSGIWVLDQFTKWQAVNWDMSGKLQLAQMDTDTITFNDMTI